MSQNTSYGSQTPPPPAPNPPYQAFNQQSYPPYQPPPPQPPKKPHKLLRNKWFWIAVIVVLVIGGIGTALSGGQNSNTPTTSSTPQTQATQAQPQPTKAPPTIVPTQPPTQPTVAPTQAATAPIPSASELSQLFSAKDGSVTNVNINKIANGSTGVALDVQVNNPTQTSVKHINYILMQFFFGSRTDVGIVNIAYHADGYTGADDPIAQCGGVSSEYSLGLDENQLWDKLQGVFNANLPA